MTATPPHEAARRRLERARDRAVAERTHTAEALRARPDYGPAWEYFLARLSDDAGSAAQRTGRPPVFTLCVQTPLEILHALGFLSWRIFDSRSAHDQIATRDLPTLACPMLRAAAGALLTETAVLPDGGESIPWVVPTTCDWVARFPDMMALAGAPGPLRLHWLDLPRLKEHPESQARWREEIRRLIGFLEEVSGRRLTAKALAASMDTYQSAWSTFGRLIDPRREGRISTPLFLLVANAFGRDTPESWTRAVEDLLSALPSDIPRPGGFKAARSRVFLSGAPVYFPNYKLPLLMEEAGLTATADDLCSSERIFPGAAFARDPSLPGLATALAERYHQGCLCPTFSGNDRRPAALVQRAGEVAGVVFHVLKGCHPHDLDSFIMERAAKRLGLRFLRLETDYAPEDASNLATRLEAFAASFRGGTP